MKSLLLLILTASLTLGAINDTCTAPEGMGTCRHINACGQSRFTVKGACPDDGNEVLCCVQKMCDTPMGRGWCENTRKGKNGGGCGGGKFVEGFCPGDESIQCCVPDAAPPPPTITTTTFDLTTTVVPPRFSTATSTNRHANKKPNPPNTNTKPPQPPATTITTTKKPKKPKTTEKPKPTTTTKKPKATKKPKPTKKPKKAGGAAILAKARTQTGVPYSWGGGGCKGKYRGRTGVGFDCSGLTQYAICQWSKSPSSGKKKQIQIPRVAVDQYRRGPRVPVAKRKVGDLLFWGKNGCRGDVYHTAIYAGNGKIFEAQKTGTNVGEYKIRLPNLCPYAVRYWA